MRVSGHWLLNLKMPTFDGVVWHVKTQDVVTGHRVASPQCGNDHYLPVNGDPTARYLLQLHTNQRNKRR